MTEEENQSVPVELWKGTAIGGAAGLGAVLVLAGAAGFSAARGHFASERRLGLQQKFTSAEVGTASQRLSDFASLIEEVSRVGHLDVITNMVDQTQLTQDIHILEHRSAEGVAKRSLILEGVGLVLMAPLVYKAVRDYGPRVVEWAKNTWENS